MPVLNNPKYELFAQARARGLTLKESYIAAGFKSQNPKSQARMAVDIGNKPQVLERIYEIQTERAERSTKAITYERDDVIRELWETYHAAREEGKHAAAKGCLELLGLERGMFPRQSKTLTGKIDPIAGMDDAALLTYIGQAFKELGMEVDLGFLAAGLGIDGAAAAAGGEGQEPSLPEAQHVPAVHEAERLLQPGGIEGGTTPDGREPAGKDSRGSLRDGVPSDRPLS